MTKVTKKEQTTTCFFVKGDVETIVTKQWSRHEIRHEQRNPDRDGAGHIFKSDPRELQFLRSLRLSRSAVKG